MRGQRIDHRYQGERGRAQVELPRPHHPLRPDEGGQQRAGPGVEEHVGLRTRALGDVQRQQAVAPEVGGEGDRQAGHGADVQRIDQAQAEAGAATLGVPGPFLHRPQHHAAGHHQAADQAGQEEQCTQAPVGEAGQVQAIQHATGRGSSARRWRLFQQRTADHVVAHGRGVDGQALAVALADVDHRIGRARIGHGETGHLHAVPMRARAVQQLCDRQRRGVALGGRGHFREAAEGLEEERVLVLRVGHLHPHGRYMIINVTMPV